MNLYYLRYFVKLAQVQHYTKAAQQLCITQPSLSHAIGQLETMSTADIHYAFFSPPLLSVHLMCRGRAWLRAGRKTESRRREEEEGGVICGVIFA
mgnify:CR=1 FL=1